jgi:voltage-gated potassium channel Kch
MINTTDALETMREILNTSADDPNISIVIVVANSETSTVKVCGLNIDEMEVPILLTETAAEIGQRVLDDLENRTLN